MKVAAAVIAVFANVPCAWAAAALPAMPADAPAKDEIVIGGEHDPVGMRCARDARKMWKSLKMTPLKVVIVKSPKWGTVWRADAAFPVRKTGDTPNIERSVCWKNGELLRPLEMFDPSQSIGRLP